MAQLRDERSLGDLFSDLSRETTTLVRQEVQLAKAELTQSATEVARGIGMLLAGGAIAYAGLLFLLLAIVFGLIQAGWDAWLSALTESDEQGKARSAGESSKRKMRQKKFAKNKRAASEKGETK